MLLLALRRLELCDEGMFVAMSVCTEMQEGVSLSFSCSTTWSESFGSQNELLSSSIDASRDGEGELGKNRLGCACKLWEGETGLRGSLRGVDRRPDGESGRLEARSFSLGENRLGDARAGAACKIRASQAI